MTTAVPATWREYLKKMYFDPSIPGSFEGVNKLYEQVKKEGKFKLSKTKIKKWLQNQLSFSLNKRVNRNFKRGKVIVAGIDDQFDADLASMVDYEKSNDGYKYLLVVIDIFSRYGWIQPLKNKSANTIVSAFGKILEEGRIPRRLRTDAATDFTSKHFQEFMKEKGITHFTTHNEKQANYVEHFIKTIKNKIRRYMSEKRTERYIDVLNSMVNSYNRTWHSGIQSEPINVNKKNERKLWWQMYWPKFDKKEDERKKKKRSRKRLFAYKVGDKVRISHLKSAFLREYDNKWSYEIFKIIRRYVRQDQPIYVISDWFGEKIEGTFYQRELQKVDTNQKPWRVEEVLDTDGVGRNRRYLVKWLGWPKKFNSWISVTDYQKLK